MISARTRTLAILGDPIHHSLTPRIQNAALQAAGADICNIAFRVSPADLERAVKGAQNLGMLGLMVTIPHKEAVLALCDELHPSAQLMGAANLLHFRADGQIEGHSSDGWGAIESLKESNVFVDESHIAILGAGGSARSLALTFASNGAASILLINRTLERAQKIAAEVEKLGVRVEVSGTTQFSLESADLLVNTTSLGMTPLVDETPIAKAHLRPNLPVFDIVYNPLETRLLREAREVGAPAIDGLGMLIYTNVYAAKVCAGVDISAQVMREEALRAFAEKHHA